MRVRGSREEKGEGWDMATGKAKGSARRAKEGRARGTHSKPRARGTKWGGDKGRQLRGKDSGGGPSPSESSPSPSWWPLPH